MGNLKVLDNITLNGQPVAYATEQVDYHLQPKEEAWVYAREQGVSLEEYNADRKGWEQRYRTWWDHWHKETLVD